MIADKHHEDSESTTANDNAWMVPSLNGSQLEWFPAGMVPSLNGYQLEWLPAGMVTSLNTADKYVMWTVCVCIQLGN